ncbi:MAG: hypothetical protein KGY66_05155 [Candidatus Thermoplasmatota archaeon]|nr:hypothetical protein [Candidatus Thermoplasmatota archaeon]MBS3790286.1 hypothetical protein [Candidatus Thermoplasmatota archaeon]
MPKQIKKLDRDSKGSKSKKITRRKDNSKICIGKYELIALVGFVILLMLGSFIFGSIMFSSRSTDKKN